MILDCLNSSDVRLQENSAFVLGSALSRYKHCSLLIIIVLFTHSSAMPSVSVNLNEQQEVARPVLCKLFSRGF